MSPFMWVSFGASMTATPLDLEAQAEDSVVPGCAPRATGGVTQTQFLTLTLFRLTDVFYIVKLTNTATIVAPAPFTKP
jgi:hypothetical protein